MGIFQERILKWVAIASPGDLPDPGIESGSPALQADAYRLSHQGSPMAEREELKSLLIKVREESEKADLKLNIQKTKIMASCPIISWQIDEETM